MSHKMRRPPVRQKINISRRMTKLCRLAQLSGTRTSEKPQTGCSDEREAVAGAAHKGRAAIIEPSLNATPPFASKLFAWKSELPPPANCDTLIVSKSYFNSLRCLPHQVVFSTEIPCSQHYIEQEFGGAGRIGCIGSCSAIIQTDRRNMYGKKV